LVSSTPQSLFDPPLLNHKLSQCCTSKNYPHAFGAIEQQIPQSKLHPAHLLTISANLQAAQKLLQKIHNIAQEKQQAHLDKLIQAAGIFQDQRTNLILYLK